MNKLHEISQYYILTKGTHLSDIMSYIVLNKNVFILINCGRKLTNKQNTFQIK
jgi:hypothetical protein